jgi:hypothetical protein
MAGSDVYTTLRFFDSRWYHTVRKLDPSPVTWRTNEVDWQRKERHVVAERLF